jgi:hypothetical protein
MRIETGGVFRGTSSMGGEASGGVAEAAGPADSRGSLSSVA